VAHELLVGAELDPVDADDHVAAGWHRPAADLAFLTTAVEVGHARVDVDDEDAAGLLQVVSGCQRRRDVDCPDPKVRVADLS